jgi:hypothetical protein
MSGTELKHDCWAVLRPVQTLDSKIHEYGVVGGEGDRRDEDEE